MCATRRRGILKTAPYMFFSTNRLDLHAAKHGFATALALSVRSIHLPGMRVNGSFRHIRRTARADCFRLLWAIVGNMYLPHPRLPESENVRIFLKSLPAITVSSSFPIWMPWCCRIPAYRKTKWHWVRRTEPITKKCSVRERRAIHLKKALTAEKSAMRVLQFLLSRVCLTVIPGLRSAPAEFSPHSRRHARRSLPRTDLPGWHSAGFQDNCGCRLSCRASDSPPTRRTCPRRISS